MTSTRLALIAGGAIALAGAAVAQSPAVDVARAQGTVGERFDGYIGVSGPVSATVRSQVAAINIKRRSLYSSLATQKGVSPSDVGLTAGCQLLARVRVGQAYLLADGRWHRRAAGEASIAPAYCR
ncbi:MAG: YdbL family protein [Sphingomicrobium sp.]